MQIDCTQDQLDVLKIIASVVDKASRMVDRSQRCSVLTELLAYLDHAVNRCLAR
jgi:hypothetical protein